MRTDVKMSRQCLKVYGPSLKKFYGPICPLGFELRVSGFLEAGRRGNGAGARTFFLKCAVFCCASEKRIFTGRGGLHGEIWGLIGDGLER